MQTIEQKRTEAIAHMNARREEQAAADALAIKVDDLRHTGEMLALRVKVGTPLVQMRRGFELREEIYDNAHNSFRAIPSAASIEATYDAAFMGGEPYAMWH